MNLESYYGKKVRIFSVSGRILVGIVNDYIEAEDNEDGLESIIIDTYDGPIEFNENRIEKIEIIE